MIKWKGLKWYDEFEEKLETTTEPISSHDLLIMAYRTNELINIPEINEIAHNVCLNFESGDGFTDEAQKIFWELEKYIINEFATDDELKKFNDLNGNLAQDLLIYEIIERNR